MAKLVKPENMSIGQWQDLNITLGQVYNDWRHTGYNNDSLGRRYDELLVLAGYGPSGFYPDAPNQHRKAH